MEYAANYIIQCLQKSVLHLSFTSPTESSANKDKDIKKYFIDPHLPRPHVLCVFIKSERLLNPDVFIAVIIIKLLDAVIACLVEHCVVRLLKQHRTFVTSYV